MENEIINRLITAILKRGYYIAVFDGEEYSLRGSRDRAAIQVHIGTSDETTLRFEDGGFLLIHGNGEDVISDYSDNIICEGIFDECLA